MCGCSSAAWQRRRGCVRQLRPHGLRQRVFAAEPHAAHVGNDLVVVTLDAGGIELRVATLPEPRIARWLEQAAIREAAAADPRRDHGIDAAKGEQLVQARRGSGAGCSGPSCSEWSRCVTALLPYGNGDRRSIPIERTGSESRHGPRSSTSTRCPASARRFAATLPPNPLPTTTTSNSAGSAGRGISGPARRRGSGARSRAPPPSRTAPGCPPTGGRARSGSRRTAGS